ncbi:MAG: zinc metallopeptidase [Pirellulales bacterium]
MSFDAALFPWSEFLIVGGLAIFAALVYITVRGLRAVYVVEGRRFSRCRLTGREVAARLLGHLRLPTDRIDEGAKIDHYDLWRKRVRLRTETSVASSVAALAIAAHEVGHAEQFAKGYWAARATRSLLVLLGISAAVLFLYPFTAIAVGGVEANLTFLLAVLAIFPILRLPITIALERDATKRAKRLLAETGLADATEREGITRLLAAAFRTHLAFSVGLIVLVGACVATVSMVESGLSLPLPAELQVAVAPEFNPNGQLPPIGPADLDDLHEVNSYPYMVAAFSLLLVWWAFRGSPKKNSVSSAIDANNRGMSRFIAGDVQGALALIDQAVRQDPGLASAHYNRAVVLYSQGQSEAALASLVAMFKSRREELEPLLAVSDPWFLRGTLRLDRDDFQGAVEDLSRAFDLGASEPAVLLRNRGLAWIRLGEFGRALADTDAALAIAPDDAVACNNRGVIHRELGDLEQAEADLRRAIELDPTLPNPREHLAKLLECDEIELVEIRAGVADEAAPALPA